MRRRDWGIIAVTLGLAAGCEPGGKNPLGDPDANNRPPLVLSMSVTPSTITTGGTADIVVQASDPDQDGVAFAFSSGHGQCQSDAAILGHGRYIHDGSPGTTDTITVRVTDSHGASATDSRTVAITAPAPGPSSTPTPVGTTPAVCGNTQCEAGETQADCCRDCGCSVNQECTKISAAQWQCQAIHTYSCGVRGCAWAQAHLSLTDSKCTGCTATSGCSAVQGTRCEPGVSPGYEFGNGDCWQREDGAWVCLGNRCDCQ